MPTTMLNNSTITYPCTEDEESKNYENVEHMFYTLYFILPFSAFAALFANIAYLIVVAVGIRRGKLPLKRYALTINRTCADILTLIVGAYFYIEQKLDRCDSHICLPREASVSRYVLQIVFILNYWCVSLSYTGIALLTNYAVRAPLKYKVNLTSIKVVKYIGIGWLGLFLGFVLCVIIVHDGELNYNSNSVIHLFLDDFDTDEFIGEWLVDLCYHINSHPGLKSLTVTIVPPLIFYVISVISYILIIQLLVARRKMTAYHRYWGSMCRLGVHLVLFASTCALTAFAYLGSFSIGQFCDQHETNKPFCLEPVVTYMWNTAAALIGWILRMIIDATVDTVDSTIFILYHSRISCHKTSTNMGTTRKLESVQMEFLVKKTSTPTQTRRIVKIVEQDELGSTFQSP